MAVVIVAIGWLSIRKARPTHPRAPPDGSPAPSSGRHVGQAIMSALRHAAITVARTTCATLYFRLLQRTLCRGVGSPDCLLSSSLDSRSVFLPRGSPCREYAGQAHASRIRTRRSIPPIWPRAGRRSVGSPACPGTAPRVSAADHSVWSRAACSLPLLCCGMGSLLHELVLKLWQWSSSSPCALQQVSVRCQPEAVAGSVGPSREF